MRRFESIKFFRQAADTQTDDFIVQPTKPGTELMAQYLRDKYQANILCPIDGYSIARFDDEDSLDYLKPKVSFVSIHNIEKINLLISEARNKNNPDSYRQAFIFEGDKGHAVFMAYIREKGSEVILYSDSIGAKRSIAESIHEKTGIDVYYTPEKRQADHHSCYTDALVFGRDTTGIDPETGEYRIPDLPGLLKERRSKGSNDMTGVHVVKLPNELLKTAQISSFVSYHKDMSKECKKIHKDKTLDQFRREYSESCDWIAPFETREISIYLLEKGYSYTKNIVIQFYLNEIEKELGHSLPKNIKTDFIINAKKTMETERELHTFSEQFLRTYLEQHPEFNSRPFPISEESISQYAIAQLKEDELDIDALASKYSLSSSEFSSFLTELTKRFDKAFSTQLRYHENRYYTEVQNQVLYDLLNGSQGLACMEFLLHARPNAFTGVLCMEIVHRATSSVYQNCLSEPTPAGNYDPGYANLILDNRIIINQLYQRQELYIFGQKDAWLSVRLLSDYPHLLDENEKTALQWVVDNRSDSSSFSDEMRRIRTEPVCFSASY